MSASGIGLDIAAAFTGLIENNAFHNAQVGVAYGAAAALGGNLIYDNVTGVTSSVGDTASGFGFVGTTLPNQIMPTRPACS